MSDTPEPDPTRPDMSSTDTPSTAPQDTGDEQDQSHDQGTVLLVRRGRRPALGFWVILAFAVTALGGAIAGAVLGVGDLAGIGYFAAVSLVVIGLPLAALAAFIDARVAGRR